MTNLRRKYYPERFSYKSDLKVVCVGNIHSGGSGKTPLVKAVAQYFSSKRTSVVLSRGYHGKLSSEGAEIDPNAVRGSSLYGDEPWMLSKELKQPVFIHRRRDKGVRAIEKKYPGSIVVLDDGFQHFSLSRDLDIVCINTDKKLTENFCLPLGELREPVSALGSADAVVFTPGADPSCGLEDWRKFLNKFFPELPCFVADSQIEGFFQGEKEIIPDLNKPWGAFCGIAAPERFVSTLTNYSPAVKYLRSFPDHWQYSNRDVRNLIQMGEQLSVEGFITTDKDWYKIVEAFEKQKKPVVSLRLGYRMPEDFWRFLEEKLG